MLVAASQLLVADPIIIVAKQRSVASSLTSPVSASAMLIGADFRVVEGWLTFTTDQWLAFSATDWRDFELTSSTGRRSGNVTASQLLTMDVVAIMPAGRSVARQIIVSAAGKTSPTTGRSVAAQIVSFTIANDDVESHVAASQLVYA